MEHYLLKYLKESSGDVLFKKYLEYLKVDLDGLLYGYGDNMNENYPLSRKLDSDFYIDYCKLLLRGIVRKTKIDETKDNILSFLAFPEEIATNYGLNFVGSSILPIGTNVINSSLQREFYLFYNKLVRKGNFNEICAPCNINKFEDFKRRLLNEYKSCNLSALFIGNGEPFLYKYHMDIFKELNRPSFIFLHGIPGYYNLYTEKKADYLCVWGEQIKKNYVDVGFDPNRILVVGNRKYVDFKKKSYLRNDLSNVLVATTGSIEWAPKSWNYSRFGYYDRNLLLVYCYSVQHALMKIGVKNVRLRVHPSVNKEWICKFVDTNFYNIDKESLNDSLNKSSMVIGPTSTVWLQSLLNGVNYLIYEPSDDGKNSIFNLELVPPFDGSDELVKVAFDEESLIDMLSDHYVLDLSILDKYIQPFDFRPVDKILKQS